MGNVPFVYITTPGRGPVFVLFLFFFSFWLFYGEVIGCVSEKQSKGWSIKLPKRPWNLDPLLSDSQVLPRMNLKDLWTSQDKITYCKTGTVCSLKFRKSRVLALPHRPWHSSLNKKSIKSKFLSKHFRIEASSREGFGENVCLCQRNFFSLNVLQHYSVDVVWWKTLKQCLSRCIWENVRGWTLEWPTQ